MGSAVWVTAFMSGVVMGSLVGGFLLLMGCLILWEPLVVVESPYPWVFDSGHGGGGFLGMLVVGSLGMLAVLYL